MGHIDPTIYLPGTTYTSSRKVDVPRLVGITLLLVVLVGVIGTLYGYATRLGVHRVAEFLDEDLAIGVGTVIFLLIVLPTKSLIHGLFNRSNSRNLRLNQWLVGLLSVYFWYCSYTGLLFEDFYWSDLLYGMLFNISTPEIYDLITGEGTFFLIVRILEFALILVLFVGFYTTQQDLFCERCHRYLTWHDFYLMGEASFESSWLKEGRVKEALEPLHFLSPKSFGTFSARKPGLEISYHTCPTCDLGVIDIATGRSVPPVREDRETSFETSKTVCHRLVVDPESKTYLDG